MRAFLPYHVGTDTNTSVCPGVPRGLQDRLRTSDHRVGQQAGVSRIAVRLDDQRHDRPRRVGRQHHQHRGPAVHVDRSRAKHRRGRRVAQTVTDRTHAAAGRRAARSRGFGTAGRRSGDPTAGVGAGRDTVMLLAVGPAERVGAGSRISINPPTTAPTTRGADAGHQRDHLPARGVRTECAGGRAADAAARPAAQRQPARSPRPGRRVRRPRRHRDRPGRDGRGRAPPASRRPPDRCGRAGAALRRSRRRAGPPVGRPAARA